MANCDGCIHEKDCREQVCLYDFYIKGIEDFEQKLLNADVIDKSVIRRIALQLKGDEI